MKAIIKNPIPYILIMVAIIVTGSYHKELGVYGVMILYTLGVIMGNVYPMKESSSIDKIEELEEDNARLKTIVEILQGKK